MNTLCFATNMTSAELASWVEAIGTVLAILGAVGVAIWQARRHHKDAMALHKAEQRYATTALAKTLLVLAENCSKAMLFLNGQVSSREAVHEIASGEKYVDVGQLERLDSALQGIPLQNLPSTLVTPTMVLTSTIRQHRQKIEQVLRVHRTMDASNFTDFFRTLEEMAGCLKATCKDISDELVRIESRQ
jgi:hypothetical protein